MRNRIIELFNIKYPVIQGGMVWCSGWKLAAAVSNYGGLGLIGAGSMDRELVKHHIIQCKQNTSKPFGVNIPLIKKGVEELIQVIIDEKVPIVFTSAGNPDKYTKMLKDKGIIVAHVIANSRSAEKAAGAGVDAIVAEGFEAGGHNGREETTTITLIPIIKKATDLPVIAAGGISNGSSVLAAMILGAEGVQIGSLFAVSKESSAHENFKKKVCEIKEGETRLTLKKLIPVRMVINDFYQKISDAEHNGTSTNELLTILGSGREKKGIFEGDLVDGELEIGQSSALIDDILPVHEIMDNLINEYNAAFNELTSPPDRFKF